MGYLGDLTNLYVATKAKLEAAKPTKRQKAVEGISLGDELLRDGVLIAFMMGIIFLLISVVPPPLHPAYDMVKPPRYVKPDWYLLWSLGPIFLAKYPIHNPVHNWTFMPHALRFDPLIDTKFLGTILVNVAFVALMVIPFVSGRSKARRPVEAPMNTAMGIFGLAAIFWLSVVGIADIIFAYQVQPKHGWIHWIYECGFTPSPSELINWLGFVTGLMTLLSTFITYWFLQRHKPRYESKLNATYFKVR